MFILQTMLRRKKVIRIVAFAALLATATGCSTLKRSGKSSPLMPGTWQSTPIVIDGDCTDWPSPYPNYDSKAMVAYATSNDKENLYITMQTGDPLTQVKILKQGMTVSIDTGGSSVPQYNIHFPLQNETNLSDLFTGTGESMQLSRFFDRNIAKTAKDCNQFTLEGFPECSGGFVVSQTLPCGISVSLSIDNYKQLVWEAVVPFSVIYNKKQITAADAKRDIIVCYSVKGFKNTSGKVAAPAPMNNTMGGGMGGANNNGRLNSMPMGNPGTSTSTESPLQHLYESTKTWKHFLISWK